MLILRISMLIVILFIYYIPGVREIILTGIQYLKHHDFEGLKSFILSFGAWSPIISITLMTVQTLVPFVPGMAITITTAWIFGWKYGALYSWLGALLGAILDFSLARLYGRPVIKSFINYKYIEIADKLFEKYGVSFIFITRLIPIMPFKVISYGAGFTGMSIYQFSLVTAIGQAPAIILYSILGSNLTRNLHLTLTITSLITIMGLLIYYYRHIIGNWFYYNKKQ